MGTDQLDTRADVEGNGLCCHICYHHLCFHCYFPGICTSFHLTDSIRVIVIVLRLGGKIITTFTVLCTTVVHSDMHTRGQFLNLHVGLGLDFVFVCLLRFSIVCVFHVVA